MTLFTDLPGPKKLRSLVDGEWRDHVHAATFQVEITSQETSRIKAGIPSGDPRVLSRLVDDLEEPLFLLYVLHTPRGEGEAGRYQSPELSRERVRLFLWEFAAYLAGDARFDLWIHSPTEGVTLVLDRHDLLFAYGNLERCLASLRELGFQEGVVEVPAPHEHHYRQELDAQAEAVLSSFNWTHSSLRPEDEQ